MVLLYFVFSLHELINKSYDLLLYCSENLVNKNKYINTWVNKKKNQIRFVVLCLYAFILWHKKNKRMECAYKTSLTTYLFYGPHRAHYVTVRHFFKYFFLQSYAFMSVLIVFHLLNFRLFFVYITSIKR